ncbi:hypothetical protein [Qipengyuania spongiae]|uniref:Flagellar hook-length control protein-like C-terminal domain-containing protein n=1 Tax=Qipengyuania spongiae TaxID=2909673 RepID=A0ABY5SYA0_9SPHN|nr:hypothetical protein [Qipengyuania spongiae]UVI39502.1 hypothetical protein L1F33_00630 [Qipengyuania spongiae]
MNISFSLPTTIDATGILQGLSGENAAKTGESEGSDGFAELLSNLAAIVPAATLVAPAQDGRQEDGLSGGKNLPVALQALPDDGVGEPANRTPEAELSAVLALLQGLGPVAQLPVPSPANSNPVASKVLAPVQTPTAHLLEPVPNANPSAIRSLSTAPASSLDAALSSIGEGVDAASARKGGELKVRITAAARPVEAGVALPIHPVIAEAARGERPAAAIDGAPLANATLATKQVPASTEARGSAATVAVSSQTSTGDTASDADRQPSDDAGTPERSAAAPRAANNVDTPKPTGPAFAAQIEDAAPALRPVASTPRPIATDPFADVERVVEHLMAARQTDLSKPAAIAVAHREFGALTVTFAPAADGMNVEIAAETNESQRALAAAMAQDRGTVRAQDTAPQSAAQQNQTAPHAQDRSASGSQSGAGFAQGHGSHQSQGDNPRSQNSDQRGRHGGTATPGNPNTARPSSDDALYA